MNIPIHLFYVSKSNVVCISLGKTVRIEIKTHASPEQCNVRSEKNNTKHSSVLLLRLVFFFSEQTLS